MASFGNFNTSAVAARSEATFAVANFNIELSLFTNRITPPREFEEIGQYLSATRLKEAQEGHRHIIARKLGILFKSLIPSTPRLIKAYGTRASEIARSNASNPRGDGQAHEATSIWVEIIAARKEEVERKLVEEGEVEQELLAAAAQMFLRSDLADWDASARAWLRVADSAMAKRQTQLRLILDNLRLPVNTSRKTYGNVVQAWTSAMVQMEKLLDGVPLLRLQSGDICLGMSSWHLYPNMVHLSSESKTIEQNDPLFQGGGIVTLGLDPVESGDTKAYTSIYWSLPLANLRYYGLPVSRCRNISTTERDRLTMDEFLWVMTTAYLKPWDNGTTAKKNVIQYFRDVATWLEQGTLQAHSKPIWSNPQVFSQQAPLGIKAPVQSWLSLFARTSEHYLSRLDEVKVQKLRNLGLEYCHTFKGEPFQHIFSPLSFFRAAYEIEDKIKLLREMAETLSHQSPNKDYEFIIEYEFKHSGHVTHRDAVEYATALPETEITGNGKLQGPKSHRRWLLKSSFDDQQSFGERRPHFNNLTDDQKKNPPSDSQRLGFERKPASLEGSIPALDRRARELSHFGEIITAVPSSNSSFPVFQRHLGRRSGKRLDAAAESGIKTIVSRAERRHRSERHEHQRSSREDPIIILQLSPGLNIVYELVEGAADGIALFRRRRDQVQRSPAVIHQGGRITVEQNKPNTYVMSIDKIMEYFTPPKVNFQKLAEELDHSVEQVAHLWGICLAANLYNNLDGATVDVRTVQMDFKKAHWVRSAANGTRRSTLATISRERPTITRYNPYEEGEEMAYGSAPKRHVPRLSMQLEDVDHAVCFACITMFETGTFNLQPDQLSKVFAVSVADSLYIASALLRDPASNPKETAIQRYTGNIRRAGIAFLVPPLEPMIRDYGIGEWYEYNRQEFDGTLDDFFSGTSLHLTFSEASMQVDVGYSGGRDIEAYLLEALVSVYDQERHIGELDVLATFSSPRLTTELLTVAECGHGNNELNATPVQNQTPEHSANVNFMSIDNFAEIIKPPSQAGIIRARGNWQARLAAASLCIAKNYRVILRPEGFCLACLTRMYVDGETQTVASEIETRSRVVMVL
ncbi:hypothetical protein LTR84_000484 [Exophiala bonariae]|uniref:Uncharacterized protein n=1 Tax=Exophiala bonariae TaxID=1690606 RepID=A0AAV9NUP8_9EURO|nr:hypothetical protein LTR84_000484 [Exophiala bonariae]